MADPIRHFALEKFIDAKDTTNTWCVAIIKSYNPVTKTIEVKYEGWGDRWDATFNIASSKIAPFRRHSRVYTGQVKTALRDWSWSIEQLDLLQNKLRGLDLGTGEAYETTQLLRGHLFTVVDVLLTSTYSTKTSELRVIEFLEVVLEYICKWLEQWERVMPHLLRAEANPDLFLDDDEVAVAAAWPELLFTLKRLFRLDERTAKFFTPFPKEFDMTFVTSSSHYFLNRFGELGGFNSLLSLVSLSGEQKVPLPLVRQLPVLQIGRFLSKEVLESWGTSFVKSVAQRIDNLDNIELKTLDAAVVDDLIRELEALVVQVDDSPKTALNTIRRSFIVQLLKCPYMEKKLKALNEIKELIKKVEIKPQATEQQALAEWIVQQQMVESVLDSPHSELLKRLADILQFLVKNDKITQGHLDLLWSSARGRHESLELVTYQLIVDLAKFLSADLRVELTNQVRSVTEIDQAFLRFIKEFFSQLVLDKHFLTPELQFGVDFLFEHLQDSSETDLQDVAAECLFELMQRPVYGEYLWTLIEQAFKEVAACRSVPQNLQLCQNILEILYKRNKAYTELERIMESFEQVTGGTVQALVRSTQEYLGIVRPHVEGVDHPEKQPLHGKFKHSRNIKERLNFIKFITGTQFISMSIDQFGELWNLFVHDPVTPWDSDYFFTWTMQFCQFIFSHQENALLFTEYFCNPDKLDFHRMTVKAYQCFAKFFRVANYVAKKIELLVDVIRTRVQTELVGAKALFQVLLKAEDPAVQEEACSLLILVNTKFGKAHLEKKPAIWGEFLNMSLDYLEEFQDQPEKTSRILQLLLSFLVGPEQQRVSGGHTITFTLKSSKETVARQFTLRSVHTIGDLRQSVARAYDQPVTSVVLRLGSMQYDSFDNDLVLSTVKIQNGTVEFRTPPKGDTTPKQFFGSSERLHSLLSSILLTETDPKTELVWSILEQLPVSPELKRKFEEFEYPLEELLETGSIYKRLYSLLIIQDLMTNKTWLEAFSEKSGPAVVCRMFLNSDCGVPSLVTRYYVAVLGLVDRFFEQMPDPPFAVLAVKILECLTEVGRQITKAQQAVLVAKTARSLLHKIINKAPAETEQALNAFSKLDEFLTVILLSSIPRVYVETVVATLSDLSDRLTSLKALYLATLVKLLEAAIDQPSKSYWKLLTHLVKQCPADPLVLQATEFLMKRLIEYPSERSSKEPDDTLNGMLTVLAASIPLCELEVTEAVVHLVLHDCLFEIPTSHSENAPPKCKNVETRRSAFELLFVLCTANSQLLTGVLTFLYKFHEDPHWRTSRYADWNYSSRALEKSETGYVGLKNLGCTCYMNSCLQQLFTLVPFRDGILRAKTQSPNSVLIQLQKIFLGLMTSDKQYVSTKGFCQTFKNWDGSPVNVYEQMDAEEFFNNFMDTVNAQLQEDSHAKLIKNYFGGVQVTMCIGKDQCTHRSERHEPFLTLQVQVKNKASLFESLETYVKGDLLEGDNAYQCDHCDAKVSALRRVCIKHLPNVLVVALRRFEYDYDFMTRVKVNDFCEFPGEIDMEPYTQEGLQRKEEGGSLKWPESYYKYRLRGVVVHSGTTESGHYYSYIKVGETWLEFNDTLVIPFSEDLLSNECFGGEEQWSYQNTAGNSVSENRAKNRNAYLLFYEREEFFEYRGCDEEDLQRLPPLVEVSSVQEFSDVKEENERYWRCRSTFAPEYFEFVHKLFSSGYSSTFALGYFLTVLLRTKDPLNLAGFILELQQRIKNEPEAAQWVLDTTSTPQVLRELLMDCPMLEKRKMVVSLIRTALSIVEFAQQVEFLKRMLNCLEWAQEPQAYCFAQYYEVIYQTLVVAPAAAEATAAVSRLLRHFLGANPEYAQFAVSSRPPDRYLGYANFKDTRTPQDPSTLPKSGADPAFLVSALGAVTEYFTDEDLALVLKEETITKVLKASLAKIAIAGTFYPDLLKSNSEGFFIYLTQLIQAINSADSEEQPSYLAMLMRLLKNETDPDRIELAMDNLQEIMQINKQFTRVIDNCVDFLLNAGSRLALVKSWCSTHAQDLKWLETLGGPSKAQAGWGSSVQVKQPNNARLTKIRKLVRGQFPAAKPWEELMPDLQPGTRVQLYDLRSQKWMRMNVEASIGELVLVKSPKTEETQWVDVLSEFLATD